MDSIHHHQTASLRNSCELHKVLAARVHVGEGNKFLQILGNFVPIISQECVSLKSWQQSSLSANVNLNFFAGPRVRNSSN